MRRLLALVFVVALATPVGAQETVRVNLYGPTCRDRAWKVEVLNHLTHGIRVELLVIKGNRDTMYVPPGGYRGMRVTTAKIRSDVIVARPSVRWYRQTGWGLLARGHANLSYCGWAS